MQCIAQEDIELHVDGVVEVHFLDVSSLHLWRSQLTKRNGDWIAGHKVQETEQCQHGAEDDNQPQSQAI